MVPARRSGCPTDLELELVLSQAAARQTGAHAQGCPHCAERLEWMRTAGERFQAAVFPRTREAVVASLAPAPRRWLWAFPGVLAAAAALSVLLVAGPPDDYVGAKGGATLEVYVGENGQGRLLSPGDVVHPGDGLRFVVERGRPVYLFTVDARGQVSRIFPAEGNAPAPTEGLMPGGAILDDVVGPERVFAVYADRPLPFDEVERAVRKALGAGAADAVRKAERLPLDLPQQSVLLEKVPR